MHLRELRQKCLELESTSAALAGLPSTASGTNPSLMLAHFLDSNVGQEPFVRMVIVGEGHEGQHGWVPDRAFDLV